MVDPPKPGSSKEPPRKSVRLQDQTVSEKKAGKLPTQESLETSPPREGDEDEDEEDSIPVMTMRDLHRQMASLVDQVHRLTQENAELRSNVVLTTESPPISAELPSRQSPRYTSATPEPPRVKLSRLISSSISQLSDGKDPTFPQWQAEVEDRLELNSDHFPTERHRMAMVYSHTSGDAKGYLEPKYLSKTEGYRFKNAEEMIELLRSYFVTGNEQAESRAAFHNLLMKDREPFSEFKARFISLAIKGHVSEPEWPFYLWQKISPALRVPNMAVKRFFDSSFDEMCKHLTAFELERRSAPIVAQSERRTTYTSTAKPKSATYQTREYRLPTHEVRSDPAPTPPRASSSVPRPASKTPVPERQATPGNCYHCGKPGHFASDCTVPRVREIEAIQEEDVFEEAAEYQSDEDRSGNDEA